jgi:LEA14-like dessication related protein
MARMRRAARASAVLLLLLTAPGCSMILTLFGKPKVERVRPSIAGVDLGGIDLRFTVDVRNPYLLPLRAPLVRYGLDIQGNEFLRSELPVQVALPARRISTIVVPIRIRYSKLWRAYRSLSGAQTVDYALHGAVSFPVAGRVIEVPLSYSGSFPVLRAPTFSDIRFRVSEMSLVNAKVAVEAAVTNPNAFEVSLQGLGYVLRLGDIEIGGLKASTSGTIGAGKTGQVTLTGEVSAAKTALELLRAGKVEKPSLKPTGTITTPHGAVDLDRKDEE